MSHGVNLKFSPKWSNGPSFAQVAAGKYRTEALKNGKRYERQATAYLAAYCGAKGLTHKVSPWIFYQKADGDHTYAQPDFLIYNSSTDITIVEIKLRHTRYVVAQILKYKELIHLLHPDATIRLVEMCKSFDPDEGNLPIIPDISAATPELSSFLWRN